MRGFRIQVGMVLMLLCGAVLPLQAQEFIIQVPEGFEVEKVVGELTFPTAITWDDQGELYVAEAGGGLNAEQLAPSRIVKVEDGQATELVNLTDNGVFASVVGLIWHEGTFYFTHRDGEDLTGAVSQFDPENGQVTEVFSGIIDSQSEHQINDIEVGPDGRMYVAVGPAGNAGVVDQSIAPWIQESPNVHTTPCQDIVLNGRNFKDPDFRTEDQGDSVLTGAYVPFGTETSVGETITGTNKCGGSILAFDPADAEGTIGMHAWGFRNLIGIAWDTTSGAMYATENGYDVRGVRPVNDTIDASLRIEEGRWYGVPDFSAGRHPLTDSTFEAPDSLQAPIFIGSDSIGKDLGFLIDHEASGLTPPDTSWVLGHHEFNSSPSGIDVAPEAWGEEFAGDVFIAEWGDLAPPTNPLRGKQPAGIRIVRADTAEGTLEIFLENEQPGPASGQEAQGQGLERPFDVKFGPDSSLYITDYGVVTIDTSLTPPYNYEQGTGAIWKVTRTEATVVGEKPELPETFTLKQNYPNPFNPQTVIQYTLDAPGHVELSIYDMQGREVIQLLDKQQPTGAYEVTWKGMDTSGDQVASGVYFYKMRFNDREITRAMTLIR